MVSTDRGKLALAVAVGACAGNAGALISTFRSHLWLLDGRGKPVPEDFVAFWAAGRQAIAGHAVAAYDGGLQHAAEVAAVGHSFSETLGWSYPPVFLVFAALLATLPYTPAFLLWMGATVAGYGGVIASIVKSRWGFLFACAAPWMVTAILPGQNGFLTAALIGASLLSLESSPSLSGLLIGLASYKPQFAFLFLAVLASAGYWRAFAVACAAAIAANVFAEVLFGFDTFHAFFNALAGAAQSHLVHAGVGWNKLQSAYGFMRSLGWSAETGGTVQALLSIAIAAAVAICWRGRAPYCLKAALLASAVPLVTPYVFVYDLPVLGVACAFLFRDREFDQLDTVMLAATVPCIFGFLLVAVPTAFFASLIIAAMAARRAAAWSLTSRQKSFLDQPHLISGARPG